MRLVNQVWLTTPEAISLFDEEQSDLTPIVEAYSEYKKCKQAVEKTTD